MAISFVDLLAAVKDNFAGMQAAYEHVTVTAPVTDRAQDVQPGGVFVARQGASFDGHSLIPQAVQNGAAAVIGQRALEDAHVLAGVPYVWHPHTQQIVGHLAAAYHDYPSRKLIVIGVTGTDGKTTTSTLIHSILQQATGGKVGFISTIAADFGSGLTDTGLHVSTPDAPLVQAYLARMVENGLTHAVLEMTSHGLAQWRLQGVDLDVAVMTNVTHEHLDYHGTFTAYREAKGKMFAMLGQSVRKLDANGNPIPKISVINGEDHSADFFAGFETDRIIRYGTVGEVDLRAENIVYQPAQTQFTVADIEYAIQLIGRFNVMNALAAIGATLYLVEDRSAVHAGLMAVSALTGRMERIDEGQDFLAMVDFAHTPNALNNALSACREMLPAGKRLITVFGSAGLRDVEKRRLMAEVAAELADFTILTAEDPRTESLDAILQMMADGCVRKGGIEGETFMRVPDRGAALFRACQIAEAGDIVIACGKGHEQSMCFGTVEYPWDDRDALRAALRGTPLKTLPTAG